MKYKVRVGGRETWVASLPESLKDEFSMEELEQMQQQFCDFDESGDGSIAAAELIVLMKSMGIDITLDEVQALIDKVDDNHSGELEFHEFVRLVSEFRRGDTDKLADFIQYSKLALAIRSELQDLVAHPTEFSRVYPVKENAWEWKVEIEGPTETPYEGAPLTFRVGFGHEYPYEPPSLACLTRIYHPNFVPDWCGGAELCAHQQIKDHHHARAARGGRSRRPQGGPAAHQRVRPQQRAAVRHPRPEEGSPGQVGHAGRRQHGADDGNGRQRRAIYWRELRRGVRRVRAGVPGETGGGDKEGSRRARRGGSQAGGSPGRTQESSVRPIRHQHQPRGQVGFKQRITLCWRVAERWDIPGARESNVLLALL